MLLFSLTKTFVLSKSEAYAVLFTVELSELIAVPGA